MRTLFIFLLIFGCTQNARKYDQMDKSDKKRRESLLRNDCELILTKSSIGATVLNSKANDLLIKIQHGNKLTEEEDIAVIMIMNTLDVSPSDARLKNCNFVFDLQKIFEESYLNSLKNKYTLCTSSSTLKFKELKIGYGGSPTSCSRYELSMNPNEAEMMIKQCEIIPEKIRL
jgi:hypothetical protein